MYVGLGVCWFIDLLFTGPRMRSVIVIIAVVIVSVVGSIWRDHYYYDEFALGLVIIFLLFICPDR